MKHASEMTINEIWAKGRQAQELGLGTGGLGSGYAARLGTMERAVRELKEHQTLTDGVLRFVVEDETCATTGDKVGAEGCGCVWCDAKLLLGGRTE